jgi:hypothetical protein
VPQSNPPNATIAIDDRAAKKKGSRILSALLREDVFAEPRSLCVTAGLPVRKHQPKSAGLMSARSPLTIVGACIIFRNSGSYKKKAQSYANKTGVQLHIEAR